MSPFDFLLISIGIAFLLGGVSAVVAMIKMWRDM